MSIELRNVAAEEEPQGFSHLSIGQGREIIHLAGRVGTREDGSMADGLAAQAEQAYLNVGRTLEAAGASEADLAKITVYVVDFEPAKIEALLQGLGAARAQRPFGDVPATIIGVQSLFTPDQLVEVDAVAVR